MGDVTVTIGRPPVEVVLGESTVAALAAATQAAETLAAVTEVAADVADTYAGVTAALVAADISAGSSTYIKTLNPVAHPTVRLSDTGHDGWYRWDAAYSGLRAYADAAQHRVISANPAVDGAWVRVNLSAEERQAINNAYRRLFTGWPGARDMEPAVQSRVPLFGKRGNFNSTSEDMSDVHYAKDGTLAADTIQWNGITLRKFTPTAFSGSLRDQRNADYLLTPGKKYIASAVIASASQKLDAGGLDAPNHFCWMRTIANGGVAAHGRKLLFPIPRRVHEVFIAGASGYPIPLDTPATAHSAGAESGNAIRWGYDGYGRNGAITGNSYYIGGLQIEEAPNQTEKPGIVTLGTSIDVAGPGAGAGVMVANARGWPAWLEGLLCQPVFCASIGGQVVASIDARFNTDVAPLAVNAKYILLCPNVNDFAAGFSSAAYRASWASIYAKAIAAGFKVVWMTINPTSVSNYANARADIAAECQYIKDTYEFVIDRAEAMRDAIDAGLLPEDWEDDGVHQANNAPNRALAMMIYHKYRHFFYFDNVPGPYQKTVNDDAKVQSFGGPAYINRLGAVRLDSSVGASTFRDGDLTSAAILVFEGTAGSAKTFQLPCANYQRAAERVNTDIMCQLIVNKTADSQNVSIQYYQRDVANALTTAGGIVVVPPGKARWVYCDGTTTWTDDALVASTGWTADTGTAKKTATATYAPGSALSFSAGYVQAEHTAIQTRLALVEPALRDATQGVKAIKDALIAAGIIVA